MLIMRMGASLRSPSAQILIDHIASHNKSSKPRNMYHTTIQVSAPGDMKLHGSME